MRILKVKIMIKFTIYSISSESIVFYIGRTCNLKRRKNEHMYENKGNTYKTNKIKKLKQQGKSIEFNILHETDSFEESLLLEIQEIKEHRENGVLLTNLTDGGEGSIGHKPIFTEEWKDKLKVSRKKLFEDGYEVVNKGKTLEELIGKEKADLQKARIGQKTSDGIKNGTRKHNKGVKIDDLVGEIRANELRKLSSDNAKKTFTGTKQSKKHINARITNQLRTKANWSEEKRKEISEKYSLAQKNSIVKHKKFIVDGKFKHYGTWVSLSLDLKKELGIIVGAQSLRDFYHGKYKSLKCGITEIKILPQ